jgi:membrane protein
VTLLLASMLGGDFFAAIARHRIAHHSLALLAAAASRALGWTLATAILILVFAVIYYFAPDVKASRWRWLSPGAAIGIVTWLLASFGLRIYLHFFNNYSVTYGSLGAVIILLMWFYITGLMLLLGAELNSEIEAAATEKRLLEFEQTRPFMAAAPSVPAPNLPSPSECSRPPHKRSA